MTTTIATEPIKVQHTFEYLGQNRTLNKHPDVATALKNGQITEEQARTYPWYLRFRHGNNTQIFKLAVNDAEAVKQAKEHLKSKGTTEFTEFLKERQAKRAHTLQELATEWLELKMPDAAGHLRSDSARSQLSVPLSGALAWWGSKSPALVTPVTMREFATWRRAKCKAKKRGTGDRSIDMELGALSCLCDWARSLGKITANPFAGKKSGGQRPKFQRENDVEHCHEFSPDSDEQWHDVLRWFFTYTYNRNEERKSEGKKLSVQDAAYTLRLRMIGGWLAFTGLTGIRPEEPQFLFRFPALTEVPGNPAKLPPGTIFVTRDGTKKMRVQRGKNGQNPFVTVHPALAEFLSHWTQWLDSTLGVPSKSMARALFPDPEDQSKSIFDNGDFTPIIRRLSDACVSIGLSSTLKPKGFGRAYYVRVRRSQGADDSVIASELGQTTNGKLIRDTYGNPDDMAGGALFDWLPEDKSKTLLPAWHLLTTETATNVIAI
jgi:hypothetical protein